MTRIYDDNDNDNDDDDDDNDNDDDDDNDKCRRSPGQRTTLKTVG